MVPRNSANPFVRSTPFLERSGCFSVINVEAHVTPCRMANEIKFKKNNLA